MEIDGMISWRTWPHDQPAERNIHSPGGCGVDYFLDEVALRGRPTSKLRAGSRVDVQ